MALLFQPLQIRSLSFKNRIVVSPMCEYSSNDGFANDWHLVHLGSRAVGGAALVIAEATAVSPEGRISPGDLGIWKDEHIEFLKRITTFIEAQGAIAGIQLAHAGRKASHHIPWLGEKSNKAIDAEDGAWQTLAPSPVPYSNNDPLPKQMDQKDIEQFISDFVSATRRALLAGFKVVEIHAAHGYLLNEFLSPLSNHRTDDYGGSFENRCRLLLQVVDNVRQIIPETLPLFVRISATDWVAEGFTIDDSVLLTNLLKEKGVDLIDCSSGGNSPLQKIPVGPLYQAQLAHQIKQQTGVLTGAVGLITTAQQAEDILQNQQADLIFLARELLRDPYFPLHAAKELHVDLEWPKQYARAKR